MIDWCKRQQRAMARDAKSSVSTKTYTVTGPKEFIDQLDRHLGLIQWLGAVGHSAWAGVYVDGDGQDRVKLTPEIGDIKESDIKTKGTYPDQFEYVKP